MPDARAFPDLEAVREQWPELIAASDPAFFQEQRWFQGRGAALDRVRLHDHAFLPWDDPDELAALNIVGLSAGGAERLYFLPLVLLAARPELPALARTEVGARPYVLAESSRSRRFNTALLAELAANGTLRGRRGAFAFHCHAAMPVRAAEPLAPDSSNTVMRLHRDEVCKMTRLLRPGPAREVELGKALAGSAFLPALHGHLDYTDGNGQSFLLAVWQEFLPNAGNLWDALVSGLAAAMAAALSPMAAADPGRPLFLWLDRVGPDLERLAALMVELHAALAGLAAPSPFLPEDLAAIAGRAGALLARAASALPAESDLWSRAESLLHTLTTRLERAGTAGRKILTHGDLHLGQILLAEDGYAVLDLEGEPLAESDARHAPTTPLRDLAGMVRSLDYAGHAAYLDLLTGRSLRPEQEATARFLLERFHERTERTLIRLYGAGIIRRLPDLVPAAPVVFVDLLDLCQMEKALYEIAYELANRPDWTAIPLAGLRRILAERMRMSVVG